MRIIKSCEKCLYDKQEQRVSGFDKEKQQLFLSDIKYILDNRKEDDSAPYMVYLFNNTYKKYFGDVKDFSKIKQEYNDFVLRLENKIEEKIMSSEDPLKEAIIYSRIGNYIDFGAMNNVDNDTFLGLLDNKNELDNKTYLSFCKECETANSFVLLADNCGEIVLDKLLLKQLRIRYNNLKCYVFVRGEEVLNDVTVEDAIYCGIDDYATVVSNGTGIAGTVVDKISKEARKILKEADVILSKGQGNYETISGCGMHIFYSFLCKCDLFVDRFKVKKLDGMFVEEKS